ncbi:MAG: cytochrome c-type biogenesis protein CcmH, partial [Actinobacteria bacterium]|nr:cytochrome c-type biogenesis protein CcmH [Actinomycetota bacterium]
CRELSVAESDARAAQAIRAEILRRVKAGQSPSTIRAFLVSRYGPDILLKPQGKGVAALVWVLPVVAFLIALTGLIFAFRRWRDLP